ncbi:hypothetical protein MN0502_13220 [Arthrobacter sp. MN05-02]|nr:hypothetical protein MN0502_13220 [Arthrobacter sp. MN05-02]
MSDPDEKGMRTVMCTLNGQMRPVAIRDKNATSDVKAAEKADPATPGHIPAPFAGSVTITLTEGQTVQAGDTVATIEAMKMEANITTPVTGTISRTTFTGTQPAQGGDLLLAITPA